MAEWAAKRFWTDVHVAPQGDGWAIRLDARPVRTPAKTPVIVPTPALADAIAAEWRAQEGQIDPLAMPVTRAANAALDKVAPQRAAVEAMIADYAGTDLLCYRAAGPERLIERQAATWDPLLDWARDRFGAALAVTTGVMPVAQDDRALAALTEQMRGMSDFELVGFHDLVSLSGSFVIALAVVHGRVPVDEGWTISRLDEDWQAGLWGVDDEAARQAEIKRAAFVQAERFLALSRPGAAPDRD